MQDVGFSAAGPASSASALVIAELVGGGLRFGVDARQLTQVVPVPPSFSGVPRAGSSLVGVLNFRHRAVPVGDLMRWHTGSIDSDAEGGDGAESAHVAVLADGSNWVGVLVHRTGGLRRMRSNALQRLHHDDDPNEFFHSVVPDAQDGQWLPVLDVARLMVRARIWGGREGEDELERDALDDAAPADSDPVAAASPATTQETACRVAVIGVGDRLYGFPVEQVATVLHRPALQRMRTQGSDLMGFLTWRGQQVPMMQAARLLGDPHVRVSDEANWALVLRQVDPDGHQRWLALCCHRIDQVRSTLRSQLRPPTELGEGASGHGAGFFYLEGAQVVRVIDAAELLDLYGMVQRHGQSGVGTEDGVSGSAGTSEPNRVGYVAFRAGKRLAVPIDRLQEILPFQPEASHAESDAVGEAKARTEKGAMVWRGRQIPLVDIAARVGSTRASVGGDIASGCLQGQCRVIVANVGDHLAGLVVGDVDLLIPAYTAEINRSRLPDGQRLAYITTERNGQRESCHLLDLDTLV